MGYYIGIPLLAIVAALQSSLVPLMRVYGGQPDFILLLVVAWAVRADLEEGIFWAFLGGILQDTLSIVPLGTSTIPLVIAVFLVNSVARQLYSFNILLLLLFVMLATVLDVAVNALVLTFQGMGVFILDLVQYVFLPTLAYNLAFTLPVYWFARWMQNRAAQERRVR